MFSSVYKKCVTPTRIRQFGTLVTCNKTCIQMKIHRCWREMKQSYFEEPKLTAHRLYTTEAEQKPKVVLSPLMDVPLRFHPPFLYLLAYPLIAAVKINLQIDREFNIYEFLEASQHAVSVISHALTNRDYDTLNGLVADSTIEVLQKNVDHLTEEQRNLIAVNREDIIVRAPVEINVRQSTNEDAVAEIQLVFYYKQGWKADMPGMILTEDNCTACNYKFERTYSNNVGGPWIATIVNHFSCIRK